MHLLLNRVKECAQEWSFVQVERCARFSTHVRLRFPLAGRWRLAVQGNLSERQFQMLMNDLHWFTLYRVKASSQHFMTRQNRAEGCLQRCFMQWSVDTHCQRDYVCSVSLNELIEEPEALLGKRKWEVFGAWH